MGGDFDLIKKMLQQGDLTAEDIRFFIGYSGWSPAQLDHEIQSRSWFVCKGHRADIMRTDEDNEVFGNGWCTNWATASPTLPTPERPVAQLTAISTRLPAWAGRSTPVRLPTSSIVPSPPPVCLKCGHLVELGACDLFRMVQHGELEGVHFVFFVEKWLVGRAQRIQASSFASSSAAASGVADFNMLRQWVRSENTSFNATSISPPSWRYGASANTTAATAPWSTHLDGTLVFRVTRP